MENKLITKEDFENALLVIKNYKKQNELKCKNSIVDSVLNMEKTKTKIMLDYVFEQDKYLGYSALIKRLSFVLNNDLLFKIGIINVKIVFKKLLENKLIISDNGFDKNYHRNRYFLP